MQTPPRKRQQFVLDAAQRTMLRCAGIYTLAGLTTAAVGFVGIGDLLLSGIVMLLLTSSLLLAAGMLCSFLGVLAPEGAEADA